ncbi:Hypothetical_protein [Hexamita inflata]|uniref:Hypothetical_protein n=1 Tax=Hexamita inflata TaxID=28002 RepID=A0AA86PUC3_9EUKA|nr:Hypothetical protein HINF_LOCUS32773 [Hexamita inflata]CAI9945133.1 Hypothetical protein HINF_LOCUS32778 [Hexamita inflata]
MKRVGYSQSQDKSTKEDNLNPETKNSWQTISFKTSSANALRNISTSSRIRIIQLFRKQLMKWELILDITLKALESERILIVRNNKNALNKLFSLNHKQMQEKSSD